MPLSAVEQRTQTDCHDGTQVVVSYDAMGHKTTSTGQAGKTTRFSYDALGRLTSH